MAKRTALLLCLLLLQHFVEAEWIVEVQILSFKNKYNATTQLSASGTLYCCCESHIDSCEWRLDGLGSRCLYSRCDRQFAVSLSLLPCDTPACCTHYSEISDQIGRNGSTNFHFLVSEKVLILKLVAQNLPNERYYHIDEFVYELTLPTEAMSRPVTITRLGRLGIGEMTFSYRTQQANHNTTRMSANTMATSPTVGSDDCPSSSTAWAVATVFLLLTLTFGAISIILTCIIFRGKVNVKKSPTQGKSNSGTGHQLQDSLHSACSREFQLHLDTVLQQRANALATRYVESGPTETTERFYDEILTSPKWEDMARPYETPVPIGAKKK